MERIYSMEETKTLAVLNGMNIKYLVAVYPIGAPGYRLISRRPEFIRGGEIYLYQNLNVLPRQYEVSSFEVITDRAKLLGRMFSGKFDPKKEILLERDPGPCARLLFVSDSYYPGWKVYVDGRERPLLRANYMFRAVALAAGEHKVSFIYDPISFKLGAMVSLLTVCGLIVYYIRKR